MYWLSPMRRWIMRRWDHFFLGHITSLRNNNKNWKTLFSRSSAVHVLTDDDKNLTRQRSTNRLNTCAKEPVNHSPSEKPSSPLCVSVHMRVFVCGTGVRTHSKPQQHIINHAQSSSLTLMQHGVDRERKCSHVYVCVCVSVCVYSGKGLVKAPQVCQAAIVPVERAGYQCPCGLFWIVSPWPATVKAIHFIFHSPHLGNNSHHTSENNSTIQGSGPRERA